MGQDQKAILALETAVGNGSLAVLRGDEVLSSQSGGASRAENLLISIEDVLDASQLRFDDLDLIAVSVGPGSYTGIRIGLSTALGLARASKRDVLGVSALPALAVMSDLDECTVAIPIGRGRNAVQRFGPNGQERGSPCVITEQTLFEEIRNHRYQKYVLAREIVENADPGMILNDSKNVQISELDLAIVIGKYAAAGRQGSLEPLYL